MRGKLVFSANKVYINNNIDLFHNLSERNINYKNINS